MGRKLGLSPTISLFLGGSRVPIKHNVAWAEAYLHTKWHLDASSRLATIERAENWGIWPFLGRVPPFGGQRLATIHQRYGQSGHDRHTGEEDSLIAYSEPFHKRSPKNGLPYAVGPLSVLSVCKVGVLWPNCWMGQDETWRAGRPQPWPQCVRCGPSSPSPKRGTAPTNFQPISVVTKWLDRSRCHLVRR